jgi:hypothetical protein
MRQELFARFRAAGKSQREAYALAGYTQNNGNASLLDRTQRVQARVNELIAERLAESQVDKPWITAKLKQNVERAMQAVPVLNSRGVPTGEWRYDGAVANKALELLGKEVGMFREIKDLNINIRDLTLEQVNQLLAQFGEPNQQVIDVTPTSPLGIAAK